MNHDRLLTTTSLLAIVLVTFHLADDIVRGFEPGGLKNLTGVAILVVWLYATLVLACRARPDVAFHWRQGQDLHEAFYLDAAGTLLGEHLGAARRARRWLERRRVSLPSTRESACPVPA